MKLPFTRAIIDAIHAGALEHAPTRVDPVFGLNVVTQCPDVPEEILWPRDSWSDPIAYDTTAGRLAGLFRDNFRPYESGTGKDLRSGGPRE